MPRGKYGVGPPGEHLRWPIGSWVYYHSISHDGWVACSVQSYTSDHLVNLSSKPQADPERIRARLKPEEAERDAIQKSINGEGGVGKHQQMHCEVCGREYWSLSGKTRRCPPCRND